MRVKDKRKVILETKGIIKRFPGVVAVDKVDFDLLEGEIHGLVGENGAGKSTFVKIIDGSYQPDDGEIRLNTEKVDMKSPQDSALKGIGMVHQELMLLPHLSVAENICISWLILNKIKKINWKEIHKIAKKQLDKLGVNYNLFEPVSNLTIAQQQIVSIARSLASNCHLLILDEPTSALAQEDVEHLFDVIDNLKQHNVAIIFISHRLKEIMQIAERVTVMRDGRKVGTFFIDDLSENKITELILGRAIKEKFPKQKTMASKQKIIQLEGIKIGDKLPNVTFDVKKGEILGIVGALGAGKSEIALSLFGSYKTQPKGRIIFDGIESTINSPADAIKKGIALVSEDRRGLGLILNQGVRFNISLPILGRISTKYFVNIQEERKIVNDFVKRLNIRCTSINQLVDNLSGGNQQKVVLAKWLAAQAKLIIMDEPTRGIDVGAKVEIYKLINELAKKGMGVILLSSEVPEVCSMADRIIVLFKGKIVKEVLYKDAHEYEIQKLVLSGRPE